MLPTFETPSQRPLRWVLVLLALLGPLNLAADPNKRLQAMGLASAAGGGWLLAEGEGDRLRLDLTEGASYTLSGTVRLGVGQNAAGVMVQSGGSVRAGGPGTDYFTLGSREASVSGSYGAYLLREGRFETDARSASGLRVGGHGLGLWEQSGGHAAINRWLAVGGPGGIEGEGVFNLLGGSLTVNRKFRILLADSAGSTGTLNLGTQAGGDAELTTLAFWGSGGFNSLVVGQNPRGERAVLNLNSGRLTLGGPLLRRPGPVRGIANLNGGILRAGVNLMDLLNSSLSEINLYRGGLTVDTQAHTVAINGTLRIPSGQGLYPSEGRLVVADGGSGYLAPPLVRVETVRGRGTDAAAIAHLDDQGRISQVLISNPGENYAPGDVLQFSFHGGGADLAAAPMVHTLGAEDLAPNEGGRLQKIGSGTLHLTADAVVPGPIVVEAGTLVVHTEAALGPITVRPGATVQGTLHPEQVVHNQGRLIPHPYPGPDAGESAVGGRPVMDAFWTAPVDEGVAPLTGPVPLTQPYLQNMSSERMVVMAEFKENLPISVAYAEAQGPDIKVPMQTTSSGGDTYFYRGTLSGLKAGTTYRYQLRDTAGQALSEWADFRTAPAGREDFMFTSLGDIQETNRGAWEADPWEPAKSMMAHMREKEPRFFLGLGDHAADGDSYEKTRLSFLERVPAKLGPSVPIYIAWGNHDGRRPLDPLRKATDMPSRFRKDGRPGVSSGFGSYAFSYSDVFFVVIEHFAWYGINDPQRSDLSNGWLDEVLSSPEAQQSRFRVVAIHWPTYSERYVDGNAALRMELAPRLKHYNVELCLSGHMHAYFRAERHGTHYIINGAGSYLGSRAPLTTDWPHGVRGGFTDVRGRYAVQSEPGVLGPPQAIVGGLFNGYGEISVRGNRMHYQQHGFNADGSYIGVLDEFTLSSRTE